MERLKLFVVLPFLWFQAMASGAPDPIFEELQRQVRDFDYPTSTGTYGQLIGAMDRAFSKIDFTDAEFQEENEEEAADFSTFFRTTQAKVRDRLKLKWGIWGGLQGNNLQKKCDLVGDYRNIHVTLDMENFIDQESKKLLDRFQREMGNYGVLDYLCDKEKVLPHGFLASLIVRWLMRMSYEADQAPKPETKSREPKLKPKKYNEFIGKMEEGNYLRSLLSSFKGLRTPNFDGSFLEECITSYCSYSMDQSKIYAREGYFGNKIFEDVHGYSERLDVLSERTWAGTFSEDIRFLAGLGERTLGSVGQMHRTLRVDGDTGKRTVDEYVSVGVSPALWQIYFFEKNIRILQRNISDREKEYQKFQDKIQADLQKVTPPVSPKKAASPKLPKLTKKELKELKAEERARQAAQEAEEEQERLEREALLERRRLEGEMKSLITGLVDAAMVIAEERRVVPVVLDPKTVKTEAVVPAPLAIPASKKNPGVSPTYKGKNPISNYRGQKQVIGKQKQVATPVAAKIDGSPVPVTRAPWAPVENLHLETTKIPTLVTSEIKSVSWYREGEVPFLDNIWCQWDPFFEVRREIFKGAYVPSFLNPHASPFLFE